jgi:ATP-dependent RNA helicase RhlE
MATFSAFNLSPKLVAALDKLGYHEPSPVQANVIPKALQGQSLILPKRDRIGQNPCLSHPDPSKDRPESSASTGPCHLPLARVSPPSL